jgi:hypothetical protein
MLSLIETVSRRLRLCFLFSVVSESGSRISPTGQALGLLFFSTSLGGYKSLLELAISTIIFSVRVGLSRVRVCVSKCFWSGTKNQMGLSQQVARWSLESGMDVRTKTCVRGKGIFPKSQVL